MDAIYMFNLYGLGFVFILCGFALFDAATKRGRAHRDSIWKNPPELVLRFGLLIILMAIVHLRVCNTITSVYMMIAGCCISSIALLFVVLRDVQLEEARKPCSPTVGLEVAVGTGMCPDDDVRCGVD